MKRLSWLLILTLVACGPATVVTPTVTPSSSSTLAPPTATSTVTLMPTNIPTLIPTPTWTPLPTLSVQEKHAKIQELLETNNGCKLPCWWGIIPGKTPWSEALHFLTPLMTEVGQGGSTTFYENGKEHYVTNFDILYEINGISERGRLLFSVQDDLVIGVGIYPPSTQDNYQLHQVLSFLGIPDQVYISARSRPEPPAPNEVPPAILVLDYSHSGVWAAYGYLPDRVGENISICPQDFGKRKSKFEELLGNIGGRLVLFDPTMEYPRRVSIEEYTSMVSGYESVSKLDDTTNMTIETFYNTFINPAPNVCLETPANLWP